MKTNNPILEKGDRVVLIYMDSTGLTESEARDMKYGEKGIVVNVQIISGIQYIQVNWDNGRRFPLWDDTDIFMKEEEFDDLINRKKNKITEQYSITKKRLIDLINKNRYL